MTCLMCDIIYLEIERRVMCAHLKWDCEPGSEGGGYLVVGTSYGEIVVFRVGNHI
jgi:hypothetical protein